MYRLTIYEGDEDALNDIEKKAIKTFSVSWISAKTYTKPFWE